MSLFNISIVPCHLHYSVSFKKIQNVYQVFSQIHVRVAYLFFGIYQGYNGSYVANLCARELHKEVKEHLHHFSDIGENPEIIKSAFQEAYRKIDKIQLIGEGEHPWKRWSGCSAVTCLLVNEILYVANVGNVKGFLIRENNTIRGITSSHDLYNRKERLRVRRNCGVIFKTERCALVNGVLDTTRGMGMSGFASPGK